MKKQKLVILESPGKVKNVSKYLGPSYVVRASFGHIRDLASGGRFGIGVDLDNFDLKFRLIPEKKDKLQNIIDAATTASEIIIATDGDREGEGIAFDLAECLSSCTAPIKRAVFTEITKKGILQGLKNAREINSSIVEAQWARRALDRVVGFLVSPFLITTLNGPNLSAGRVQSVAVKLIVDREREIESFQPEEYWNISACLQSENKSDFFWAKYFTKNTINNQNAAEKIQKELQQAIYTVSQVEEKEKKRNPYPPLITSSLTALAAGKYKFSANKTMRLAQALYEAGLITYMRTDSFRLSTESVEACRQWLVTNSHPIPAQPNVYHKAAAQDAHEAIRPTDVSQLPQNIYMSEEEQKVYQLIWSRFVASQMMPALYDTVSVIIQTSNNHTLKAQGRVLKFKGWLEMTQEEEEEQESETKMPPLTSGELLQLYPPGVKIEQKFTQPPNRFSEKTLIKELERRGIGRPSTYASIMSKICERQYVIENSHMFTSTDLGKQVIDSLDQYFDFVKYDYTAEMEKKLDQIAEGQLNYLQMMQDFYLPFASQLRQAYIAHKTDYGFTCEICQEMMELRHGKFGFYMACLNYPKTCKNTFSCEMVNDRPVKKDTFQITDVLCPKCSAGMIKKDGKFGPYYACSIPKCTGTAKVPYGKTCPQCKNQLYLTIFQGQDVLFCMGYHTIRCTYKEVLNETKIDPVKLNHIDVSRVTSDPKYVKKLAKRL